MMIVLMMITMMMLAIIMQMMMYMNMLLTISMSMFDNADHDVDADHDYHGTVVDGAVCYCHNAGDANYDADCADYVADDVHHYSDERD